MLSKTIKLGLVGVLMATTFALTACNEYVARTNKKVETTLERVEEHLQQAQIPDLPAPVDTVRTKSDIWLGTESVKISEGDALPARFEEDDSITLSIAEEATLPTLANEIMELTGITVRLDNLKAEEAIPEETVPMNYTGKLSGLLNYISNRYSVWWRYKSGIITFFTKETRVFNIYALPTETQISTSMNGATMGEGGGSSSSTLSSSANFALWEDIEKSLEQVVGENAELSFSRVAGTVTVTGSPFIIREAADWIDKFNTKLSRQVAISVRVFMVTVTNKNEYGFDPKVAFQNSDISATLASPINLAQAGAGDVKTMPGSIMMTLLKPSSKWKGEAAIKALSQLGKTSLVTSASVTTLNNKVAPVQITTQQKYVSEVTVTTTGSGDDKDQEVDVETETLNYGFILEVMPRILDHGRLILMFSMNLTELLELKPYAFGGGNNSSDSSDSSDSESTSSDSEDDDDENESTSREIQLPKMEMRGFIQEIAMRSGSTLVLTGFERVKNTLSTSGVGRAKMGILGGTADDEQTRDVMVILLTPEILESPLSPESRMRDF